MGSVAREIQPDFPEISREVEEVEASLTVDHSRAVGMIFGRPCYNPGPFLGALHAVQTSDSYPEAVRKTIIAGGCNCSRAFFIGAMLGAKYGVEGIPRDWIFKTTDAENILKL